MKNVEEGRAMSGRTEPLNGRNDEYSVVRPATIQPIIKYSMELMRGIDHLARLSWGVMGLGAIMTQVAILAKGTVSGVDGVGLILIETDRPNAVTCSDEFVAQLNSFETRFHQGISTSAMIDLAALHSGSLGAEPRWKQFGSRAARLGVHSAVSTPLLGPAGVIGALTIYARSKHAFNGRAQQICQTFGEYASIVLFNAHSVTQEQRRNAVLQAALVSRPKIDQAIGILISRSGGTEEEVVERLREISRRQHKKLAVVAAEIVEQSRRNAATRANRGHYDRKPTSG